MAYAQVWGLLGMPGGKTAYLENDRNFQVTTALYKNPPKRMKSKVKTEKFGIATMRNNFIYNVTENVMSALVESGIAQYFFQYIKLVVLKGLPTDQQEPKKFSIEDLKFGFVIFLICCGISIVAFLCEILMFYGRKFFGFYIFFKVIRDKS